MPNWNRILVGDAFKVQPGGFDYYRDLFLLWPFLGFSMVATSVLMAPKNAVDRIFGLKLAGCALVVLLLAKERRLLLLVAPSYVFLHMAVGIIFIHTWQILEWLLVSGGILLAVFWSGVLNKWKPSYVWPTKLHALDIAIGTLGLAVMMAIGFWMKR
jgi:hypothetical protein